MSFYGEEYILVDISSFLVIRLAPSSGDLPPFYTSFDPILHTGIAQFLFVISICGPQPSDRAYPSIVLPAYQYPPVTWRPFSSVAIGSRLF